MTISVIISTYNGGKYIKEQLQSILEQTVKPDNVFISDDSSTDNTCEIVEKFMKQNNLTNWYLSRNQKNVGWKRNFYKLLKSSVSQFTFLCDQDDIWVQNKIEVMIKVMEKNEQISLLCTDYIPKYESKKAEKISKKILSSMSEDNKLEKINLSPSFFNVLRPGCTYCIRKELIDLFDKYPFDNSSHDSILWNLAILTDGLFIYHYPTIYFRRHDNNATPENIYKISEKIAYVSNKLRVIQNLKEVISEQEVNNLPLKLNVLEKQNSFYSLRLELLTTSKIRKWLKLQINYSNYYFSGKQLYLDLILSLKSYLRKFK